MNPQIQKLVFDELNLAAIDLCFQQVTWSVHELIKKMCTLKISLNLDFFQRLKFSLTQSEILRLLPDLVE